MYTMSETIIKNPSWWNRRTNLERWLLILAIIFITTTLSLAVFFIYLLLQAPAKICVSPKCIHTASQVLKNMDRTVDPCDNFYNFACGNFARVTEIPKAKVSISLRSIIQTEVQKQIRQVIEEPIQTTDPKTFRLAKKFYMSCINESNIELRGLYPLKKILNQLGGWPVLEGNKWKDDDFDWKNLTHDLKEHGFLINHLFSLVVGTDIKNPKRRVLQLFQANTELPRELLVAPLDDRSIIAYLEFMIDVAEIFGADRIDAKTELFDALLFQKKLGEISVPQIEFTNATALYNPMTIEELQQQHPSIPWLEFINNMLSPSVEINENEIIINQTPSFISELEKLLRTTPARTIANYLIWQVVNYSIFALPKKLKISELRFLHVAAGVTELEPRWNQCLTVTYKHFDLIIASMYVRKYFDRESKNQVQSILNNVKAEFRKRLMEVDWMDPENRKSAVEKLDAMHVNTAYPDELLDDAKLDEVYENVTIRENLYFESSLIINQWDYDFSYSYLRKPVNRTEWIFHGHSASVGAYYTFAENSILIPAGILQASFFSSDLPNYVNYGGIGFTIGHEITHGFDNVGRQYDKNGIVVDWWSPSTMDNFITKSQCIIEQYNNFTIPKINLNVDGLLTEGENIADNGGIKSAYRAYKKWLRNNQDDEFQLPGLSYTPLQMFWLSMASNWCSHDLPEHIRTVPYDSHAPNEFRIIGSMSNQPEFSKDFHCSIGSYMNPREKCQIW